MLDALGLARARGAGRLRRQLRMDRLRPQARSLLGREIGEREVEDLLEGLRSVRADLVDGQGPAELRRDRRERRVRDRKSTRQNFQSPA